MNIPMRTALSLAVAFTFTAAVTACSGGSSTSDDGAAEKTEMNTEEHDHDEGADDHDHSEGTHEHEEDVIDTTEANAEPAEVHPSGDHPN